MQRNPGRAHRDRAILAAALGATLVMGSGAPIVSAASASTTATSAATSGKSSTATKSAALPPAPSALKPGSTLAPFTLPVNGFGAVSSLASTASQIDASALPSSVLEQRTYFEALTQWEQQGAKPVSPSTKIVINAAASYQNVTTTVPGAGGAKVIAPGGLAGNTQAALALPNTVQTVDFPFTVQQTGLYAINVNYYNYPECFTPATTTVASFESNASANTTGPYCGNGTSAERGILIDPPGTVSTVPAPKSAEPTVSQSIITAAEQSGIPPSSLPAWINPQNDYLPVAPVPAWTIPTAVTSTTATTSSAAAHSTSATAATTPAAAGIGSACAVNLFSANGVDGGYNGYQYQEAKQIPFPGNWSFQKLSVNQTTGYVQFAKDNQGDNLYPLPKEREQWQKRFAYDAQGVYGTPLLFCLTAGTHVLQLALVRDPMAIQTITFQGQPNTPTYAQALAQWKAAGMQAVTCGMCAQVQADNVYRMSDPTIQPGSDPNPAVKPATHGYFILNELNGATDQNGNEWVEYQVTVPQTGLYKLGFMELQAAGQGLPASRRLTIDGQVPFQGAQWIGFPFKNSWNMVTLAQPNGSPALIGLTKGTHIIRLETNLGLVGEALTVIQQVDQRLGELNREVLQITGPNPNPQVDYNLTNNVPGLIPQLTQAVSVIRQMAAILTYDAGGVTPSATGTLIIAANDFQRMISHPSQIQDDIAEWHNDESSLSSLITQLQAQPLTLNSIDFASPSYHFPSPVAPLFQRLATIWNNFILSFYRNYTGVGSIYSKAISVWVGFGQTWAAVMSELTNSEFTPLTGIHVNFNVVPGGAGIVLLSEVAGHGPDVATGLPATTPVDFALRGGAVNLSSLPHWSTIAQRFAPNAYLPYEFTNAKGQSGVFGLPETQGMTMMIYRSDILSTLVPGGLKPPQTWQELYYMLPILTAHGMEFLYPAGPAGFLPFLYQNGGAYYKNSSQGIVSALTSQNSYQAFKAWTSLWLNWNVPISANLFTRFQTGEVPLAIGAYNDYVTLQAAAPELQGLWSIAPIPATAYLCTNPKIASTCQVDTNNDACTMPNYPPQPAIPAGETCVYNDTSGDMGTSTADIIPKSSHHIAQAWTFLQWWTSTPVQLQFASGIEAIGGVQLAWNTSNIQALQGLPWPSKDLQIFHQILQSYKPEPVVPGGYLSDRYVNDIWTNVVINNMNPRAQLDWAVQNINDELYRQEVNYGLAKTKQNYVAVGG